MRGLAFALPLLFAAPSMAQTGQDSHAMGGRTITMISLDRAEIHVRDGADLFVWDGSVWTGGDLNRLWIESEGAARLDGGGAEEASLSVAWGRAITPFFDLKAGLRQDFEPRGRTSAMLGVHGLAPYWFDIDARAFLSHSGDVTASASVEYDLLLTQRLILQPEIEAHLAFQDIAERDLASGFTEITVGARLRYEFAREFAPYIGVEWSRHLGGTARIARAAGNDASETALVLGVRAWF